MKPSKKFIYMCIGTHCVHVDSTVHALRTCLFTDTHSLTMADDIVVRALYSALHTKPELVIPSLFVVSGHW